MSDSFQSEIDAMSVISKALSPLDSDAIHRVLNWANQYFQVKPIQQSPTLETQAEATSNPDQKYSGIDDLFVAANPTTGLERVMVAAFWFQVHEGLEDWDSFQINKELKHLGYGSGNITRDLDSLMGRSPRLVIQIRKEGNTQQARKRYKLTLEGTKFVKNMINSSK